MRISLIIIALISLGSCKEYNPQLNNIRLYGHGGGGFDNINSKYPANSVTGMKEALDIYELDGIEVDVQFTKDSNLLVFHDVYLENSTQCKGKINSVNLEDATGCYYRNQFSNSYNDQVISFDSLVMLMNTLWSDKYLSINLQLNLEDGYKPSVYSKYFIDKLSGLVSIDKVTIECYDANFLLFLEREDSTYQTYLIANINQESVQELPRFGLDGIVSEFNYRDQELEKNLIDSGYSIFLYGAKLASDYTDYEYKYITGIQVDNPILALKYFRNQ